MKIDRELLVLLLKEKVPSYHIILVKYDVKTDYIVCFCQSCPKKEYVFESMHINIEKNDYVLYTRKQKINKLLE